MGNEFKPLARKDKLVVQELNGEVLIYDLSENRAFCLNDTATAVWQACDGENTIAEIGKKVGNEDLVWLALDQLKREKLITNNVESKFAGISRREVIKKVGIGSMIALPIVSSLAAPLAIHANSACVTGGNCTCNNANGTGGEICSTNAAGRCGDTNCRCQRTATNQTPGTCVP